MNECHLLQQYAGLCGKCVCVFVCDCMQEQMPPAEQYAGLRGKCACAYFCECMQE
jgi:hypothetical protein